MKLFGCWLLVIVCMLLNVQTGAAQEDRRLKNLTAFSMMGSDGRSYTLRNLTAGKPVLLVFFCNDLSGDAFRTFKDWNRLSKSLSGKVRVVGIVVGTAKENRDFIKSAGLRFLALRQESNDFSLLSHIAPEDWRFYQMRNALVLADGRITHVWNGYSRQTLSEMELELKRYTGIKPRLNLSRFPQKLTVGQSIHFD